MNNGNINANNQYFNVNDGSFINTVEINLAGNFGISADSFINTGEGITVNTFSLSATGNFNYAEDFVNAGNINANNLNFILNDGDFINSTVIILEGNLGISADNFINTGGTVTATNQNFIVRNDSFTDNTFTNTTEIELTGTLGITANVFENFSTATIIADTLNILVDSFINYDASGGTINVNTISLSVEGDFDYSSDYRNNGLITATNQYFTTRNGDFTNTTTTDIVLTGDLQIVLSILIILLLVQMT